MPAIGLVAPRRRRIDPAWHAEAVAAVRRQIAAPASRGDRRRFRLSPDRGCVGSRGRARVPGTARPACLELLRTRDWSEGMGSSLRLGLESLLDGSPLPLDAVILMLCDQPLLTAATLEALSKEYAATSLPDRRLGIWRGRSAFQPCSTAPFSPNCSHLSGGSRSEADSPTLLRSDP